MDASIAYSVAKVLPKEELIKLYNMLKADLCPIVKKNKTKSKSVEYTDEEAQSYLFNLLNINEN